MSNKYNFNNPDGILLTLLVIRCHESEDSRQKVEFY
jgi:hypothetical protein